jgi:hypothetical protein
VQEDAAKLLSTKNWCEAPRYSDDWRKKKKRGEGHGQGTGRRPQKAEQQTLLYTKKKPLESKGFTSKIKFLNDETIQYQQFTNIKICFLCI